MGSAPENFDYIIVGGGTAGLTVANRLSEDASVKVLVIEAGQDHSQNPLVQVPGLVVGMYGKPEYDWNFSSTPQVSEYVVVIAVVVAVVVAVSVAVVVVVLILTPSFPVWA